MLTKQEEFIMDWVSAHGDEYFAAGRAEERRILGEEMLKQGLSPEMVASITGLPLAEVQALR